MTVRKRTLCALFFIVLLITEFLHISIGGGTSRIYHLLMVPVLAFLWMYLPVLFTSKVFLALLAFWGFNLIAVALAASPAAAILSFMGLSANVGISIATALILVGGRFDVFALRRLLMSVTLASVLWGIVQVVLFRFAGVSLALSGEQESQLALGLAPAFRTEANTFGKYLVIPFLFYLPELMRRSGRGQILAAYAVLIVGFLLTFTRSAIYGLAVALPSIFLWYLLHGQAVKFLGRGSKLALVLVAFVFWYGYGVSGVSEYGLYKLENLLSRSEIMEGGSGAFRILMMENTWNAFLTSMKTIVFGNGWGQIFMLYDGEKMQTGGGDLLTSLGYGGLLGGVSYLILIWQILASAARAARVGSSLERVAVAEGVMFAAIGVFFVGQMSGYMVAPEFWMLIGMSIYLGVAERRLLSLSHA